MKKILLGFLGLLLFCNVSIAAQTSGASEGVLNNSYLRLDGTNSPVTGAVTFDAEVFFDADVNIGDVGSDSLTILSRFILSGGGTIESTSNGNIDLDPNGSGKTRLLGTSEADDISATIARLGTLTMPDDSASVIVMDVAVTTATATNGVVGYIQAVDGSPVLGILATSNGLGSMLAGGVRFYGHRRLNRSNVGFSSYFVSGTADIIAITTTESVTVTLPQSFSLVNGWQCTIKDEAYNASSNNHTITGEGGALINNSASQAISTNGGSLSIYSDGLGAFHVY